MYREISFNEFSKELLEQLRIGAFLTVKAGEELNTMTIAWGSLGYMWNKPVFTAMVRYSRHTFGIIEKAEDFTVSFPLKGQLRRELGICGTKSGRDMDKFHDLKLAIREGERVNTPIIDGCDLHLECGIVFKNIMDENNLSQDIKDKSYQQGDYHVLYYGEILKAYIRE